MIRVLVVDDHVIVRNGLEHLLATCHDIELVGTAPDGSQAVALVGSLQPDVVLMDLSMPVMDGATATRLIAEQYPDVRVVILTSFGDQERILDALASGADGYLLKHSAPAEIIAAIRAVSEGGSPLDPMAARALIDARRIKSSDAELTDRERQVLELVRQGLANKQIARKLDISERTVKAHLTHVFQRLGVTDRTQAALWAQQQLGRR